MSLTDILTEIKREGEQQARQIVEEAQGQTAQLLAKAQEEADALYLRMTASFENEAQEKAARKVSLARVQERNGLLAAKQAALEEVFAKALARLHQMPPEERQALIKNLLVQLTETGEETVWVAPADEPLVTSALLAEVNERLAAAGKKGKLSFGGSRAGIDGGIILTSGDVEINGTLSAILNGIREEMEMEVASILFRSVEREG